MRPGLSGWTSRVSGQGHSLIFEYRLPFRKNWLIRKAKDPQITIVQSRSGFIHIGKPHKNPSQVNSHRTNWFNPKTASLSGLVVVIAILFVWVFSQVAPQQSGLQKKDSQLAMELVKPPAQCSDSDVISTSNIQNALNGLPSKLKIVERSASVELGGYRLTSITVECQLQRHRLKITEAKIKSTWKLKKTARLEN